MNLPIAVQWTDTRQPFISTNSLILNLALLTILITSRGLMTTRQLAKHLIQWKLRLLHQHQQMEQQIAYFPLELRRIIIFSGDNNLSCLFADLFQHLVDALFK